MPRLMAMMVEGYNELKQELTDIKKGMFNRVEKGELLKGYNGIKNHYKYGTEKINKLIAMGAPINKVGSTIQCYTNELDDFIASLKTK